ncbi:MAG: hypothetical protein NC319_04495 [Butyricicoccus sp.]|nr:hypothetical protein [Butyricicoccus sp.]
MGDIVDFGAFDTEPDIYSMSRGELMDHLDEVREQIGELDEREPEDLASEEYDDWADRHERLEDLADEIQDLLDS